MNTTALPAGADVVLTLQRVALCLVAAEVRAVDLPGTEADQCDFALCTALLTSQALRLCGAENIFADATAAYPQVSSEALLQRQPDLIVQPVSTTEPRHLTDYTKRFASLKAVQLQQRAQPNADLLHRATIRTLDGVAELCQLIDQSRQFYATKSGVSLQPLPR